MDDKTDLETTTSNCPSKLIPMDEKYNRSQVSLAINIDLEKQSTEEKENKEVGEDEQGIDIQSSKESITYKAYREGKIPSHPPASHTTSTIQQVSAAQDWTGPNDPDNPRNWPIPKCVFHTIPPAFFAFATTFGSSVYAPAAHDIMATFHVSHTSAMLPLSLYVIGLAFGPMIAAPLSETYGRLIVYRLSLPISMLFTLGAGFSKTFASIVICRFFAGMAGSPVLAVGAGTNSDVFPPHWRALSTSTFLWMPFMGPCLGPVVGGFAAQYKGYAWTQWCMLFASVPIYILSLPMRETYKKIILKQRSERLNLPGPPPPTKSWVQTLKFLLTVTLFRPAHMLFFEPIVCLMSLYTAFLFALFYVFFAAFPIVFGEVYHFSLSQSGLTFLASGIAFTIAVPTNIAADRLLYMPTHRAAREAGKQLAAPEHRLYSAMMGSLGVSVGLFWFAWTARRGVHWIVPVIGTMPFAWGNLCIFTATSLYLIDVYGPQNGASAVAANSLARYVLGAMFPLFTVQMFTKLGIAWAISLLGLLSVVMLPIPWVLYRWGPKIRANSHYETMKA